jgi:hypothetical protein
MNEMNEANTMHENRTRNTSWRIAILTALAAAGCGGDAGSSSQDGSLTVLLAAEQTIPRGIHAGNQEADIRDGFDIDYSRYLISVGLVAMNQIDGANAQSSDAVAVADFVNLPKAAPELTVFEAIPIGQYTEFGFRTPPPSSSVVNLNSADPSDVEAMITNRWSYFIEGTITRVSDGATRDFRIEADVPSVFTACAAQGLPLGVNVSANSSVEITMHGDHLFFNGFPEDEGKITRLAQWLWDIEDVDGDEVITKSDFEAATDVGSLFPSPPVGVYELTGGPLTVTTAWDFVRAQLGTQGHIFGEGECEWGNL